MSAVDDSKGHSTSDSDGSPVKQTASSDDDNAAVRRGPTPPPRAARGAAAPPRSHKQHATDHGSTSSSCTNASITPTPLSTGGVVPNGGATPNTLAKGLGTQPPPHATASKGASSGGGQSSPSAAAAVALLTVTPPSFHFEEHDAVFLLWQREHPDASAEERRQEILRRYRERTEHERMQRHRMLSALYEEEEAAAVHSSNHAADEAASSSSRSPPTAATALLLPKTVADARGVSPATGHHHGGGMSHRGGATGDGTGTDASLGLPSTASSSAATSPSKLHATIATLPGMAAVALLPSSPSSAAQQKAKWERMFSSTNTSGGGGATSISSSLDHTGSAAGSGSPQPHVRFQQPAVDGQAIGSSNGGGPGGTGTTAAAASSSSPPRLSFAANANRIYASITDNVPLWIQKTRKLYTHVHEEAALKIQCAFRVFLARRVTRHRRDMRRELLHQVMLSEESVLIAWDVAVATGVSDARHAQHVDRTARVLTGFLKRVMANSLCRKMAAQRQRWERRKLEVYAATRLQAMWRGILCRKRHWLMMHPDEVKRGDMAKRTVAATRIQRVYRGHACRTRMTQRRRAALRVQCIVRRHLSRVKVGKVRRARRELDHFTLRHFSASVICRFARLVIARAQRLWRRKGLSLRPMYAVGRGYLTRRFGMTQRRLERREQAAITVQKYVRRYAAECRLQQKKELLEVNYRLALHHHAAVIMQRAARHFLNRRRNIRLVVEADAAITVQRAWRGHVGRQDAQRRRDANALEDGQQQEQTRRDAATLINAAARGFLSRKAYAALVRQPALEATTLRVQRDSAGDPAQVALVIQRWYRDWIRRPKLRDYLRRTVVRLTRFLRSLRHRKALWIRRQAVRVMLVNEERRDLSALLIQRALRGHAARNVAQYRRIARSRQFSEQRQREAAEVLQRFVRGTWQRRRAAEARQRWRQQRATEEAVAAIDGALHQGTPSREA